MPDTDTQTLETTGAHEHERPGREHGPSESLHAAAVEAAYILETVRR